MRDVNGQIYWNHATEDRLLPLAAEGLVWDAARRALTLQPSAALPLGQGTRAGAQGRAAQPRIAVDAFGTWARASADGRSILTGMEGAADRLLWSAPADLPAAQVLRDLDWTTEGHLLAVLSDPGGEGVVLWLDPLLRFDPFTLRQPGFAPDRIAAARDGSTVWLVDRARQQARRLAGTPIPDVLTNLRRAPDVFAPRPEMADPPRLEAPVLSDLTGEEIIDAVAAPDGALILLRLPAADTDPARLERVTAKGQRSSVTLTDVILPFTLTPLGPRTVAIACETWAEARVFAVPEADAPLPADPLGPRLPLRDWTGQRFCAGVGPRAHYPIAAPRPFRRLAALSYAAFATSGLTDLPLIDSGAEGFVWHRMYLEAVLPKGTAVEVLISASDREDDLSPVSQRVAWHPHRFGAAQGVGPRGTWMDADSERPWGRSALDCPRQNGQSGLFSALIQTTGDGLVNHRLAGRFLRLRLVLTGTGAASPRIAALRVWGPRFSWRDRYLPELYRVATGPGAPGSDFLDRYLALFESLLTPLEGEVAMAHRLANPATIPAEGLDWLAAWLGLTPDAALGEAAVRRLIGSAARLAPWRGTLRGLQGALDIASDGAVTAGRIVVVEHFRMQRTFATILGADYSDLFDPLTRGSGLSGNSLLGPAFFLGAEDEKRLFALFRPEVLRHDLTSPAERAEALRQMQALTEDAAHRVTVLVHDETDPDRIALLSRVIARETPAHVVAALHLAPGSLLLGLQALLGVESWLGPQPEPQPVILGETRIGQGRLRGRPSIDQRI